MPRKKGSRAEMLDRIRNPLIFNALALLVIEGLLGLVIGASGMSSEHKFYAFCIMAILFLIVVLLVGIIAYKRPRHLYEFSNERDVELP